MLQCLSDFTNSLQAKEDLRRIFDALPATEQEALLKANKKEKAGISGIITFSPTRAGSDENMPINSTGADATVVVSFVRVSFSLLITWL